LSVVSETVCYSGRGRHTRFSRDWSSDVCSSDLRLTPPICVRRRWPADGGSEPAGRIALTERSTLTRSNLNWKLTIEFLIGFQIQIGRASCRERGWISVWAGSAEKERKP